MTCNECNTLRRHIIDVGDINDVDDVDDIDDIDNVDNVDDVDNACDFLRFRRYIYIYIYISIQMYFSVSEKVRTLVLSCLVRPSPPFFTVDGFPYQTILG